MKIMQGDEYDIYINLKQDGNAMKPNMVDDIEVYIGTDIRKTYSNKTVLFDSRELKWYIRLTQQETLAMEEGQHQVYGRIKYNGVPESDVVGIRLEGIVVMPTTSQEVL